MLGPGDARRDPAELGSVLGSRKLLDPALSWNASNGLPAQPHLVLDADRPLVPNAVTRFDIALQPPAWRVLKGHSLRLLLASQTPPTSCGPNALLGKPAGCLHTSPMLQTLPGGVYTILHDPAHPSLVNVPLVPSRTLTTAKSGVTPTSQGVVLPQDWGSAARAAAAGSATGAATRAQAVQSGEGLLASGKDLPATGGSGLPPAFALALTAVALWLRRETS